MNNKYLVHTHITHPNQWTIIKLWNYRRFHQNAAFIAIYLETRDRAWSLRFAFLHKDRTCSLKFKLLPIVTLKSSWTTMKPLWHGLRPCNFIKKESLAQVFFCEFCEVSKSTFFYRTPLVAASARNNLFKAHTSNKRGISCT